MVLHGNRFRVFGATSGTAACDKTWTHKNADRGSAPWNLFLEGVQVTKIAVAVRSLCFKRRQLGIGSLHFEQRERRRHKYEENETKTNEEKEGLKGEDDGKGELEFNKTIKNKQEKK